jgi:uncharacterized protein (TIGR02246 family)
MTAREVVVAFVEAINRGDVEGIAGLMARDHLFIDSLGKDVRGQKAMRQARVGYFKIVPDCKIEVEETVVNGQTVILLAHAGGTYSSDGTLDRANRWRVPAAWRAVVEEDRVAVWQVFADNEPIRRIMRRYGKLTD